MTIPMSSLGNTRQVGRVVFDLDGPVLEMSSRCQMIQLAVVATWIRQNKIFESIVGVSRPRNEMVDLKAASNTITAIETAAIGQLP
jgi:hypothetical protein